MIKKDPRLRVLPSPLLKQPQTSAQVMRDVIYALIPATLAGIWLFGPGALLVLIGAIAGCMLGEYWFSPSNIKWQYLRHIITNRLFLRFEQRDFR